MAKIEIDENEYVEMKRVTDVARLIAANPKARPLMQQAIAEAAPDQIGPEHRIRQEVDEKIGGLEKTIREFLDETKAEKAAREAEETKRTFETRWLGTRNKAREAGYTDEGLEKLEAWMEKRGVADHEIAIPAFERENPPPEPVVTGGRGWDFFNGIPKDQPDLQALLNGNDEAFLATAIPAALNDVRGGGGRK